MTSFIFNIFIKNRSSFTAKLKQRHGDSQCHPSGQPLFSSTSPQSGAFDMTNVPTQADYYYPKPQFTLQVHSQCCIVDRSGQSYKDLFLPYSSTDNSPTVPTSSVFYWCFPQVLVTKGLFIVFRALCLCPLYFLSRTAYRWKESSYM